MSNQIVYVTRSGTVEERELVNETPKGFRVGRRNYTTMELSIQYVSGYRQFDGKSERFEIATLNKDEANAHALQQRKDIGTRIVQYQDYWLKHIGINPNQYKEMLNMSLELDEETLTTTKL